MVPSRPNRTETRADIQPPTAVVDERDPNVLEIEAEEGQLSDDSDASDDR